MNPLQRLKYNIINGKGIFMVFRSMLSSQISSFIDYALGFALYAWVGLTAGNGSWATAIGATVGGIVNCAINYRFTFKIRECSYWAIGVKFFMVWLGSLLLNTFGTAMFTRIFTQSSLLDHFGFHDNLAYTVARLFVALVVSIFWNFLLLRYFVFRTTKFDNFIDRIYYYLSATRFFHHK